MMGTASKTASASHIELTNDEKQIWWSAYAVPCLSIFAPYSINSELPKNISNAGATFSEDSLWWKFERLQYAIEQDYTRYMPIWKEVTTVIENEFRAKTVNTPTYEQICENTEIMEKAVDNMYEKIIALREATTEPQHMAMNQLAKDRAKIKF